jgi:hypothetical protein
MQEVLAKLECNPGQQRHERRIVGLSSPIASLANTSEIELKTIGSDPHLHRRCVRHDLTSWIYTCVCHYRPCNALRIPLPCDMRLLRHVASNAACPCSGVYLLFVSCRHCIQLERLPQECTTETRTRDNHVMRSLGNFRSDQTRKVP